MTTKKVWTDESGITIPANRITKAEKLKEARLEMLAKKASYLNERLVSFKSEFAQCAAEIFKAVMEENGITKTDHKGNFLVKNFNGSIKAEVDVNERIEFDPSMILIAKGHFDEFLSIGASAIDEMIRELILDAFSTSRGKLDAKKVTSLIKYKSRIDPNKYPSFHKAIEAIEKGISRPSSKRYFRISTRDTEGKYIAIDLNFSSI
jgi:hypothetical protein